MTLSWQPFRDCLSTLRASKHYIFAIAATFAMGIGIGLIYPDQFTETLLPIIRKLLAATAGLSPLELSLFIFHNNLLSALIGLASGAILGIFPFIHALGNGIVVGFVLHKTHLMTGSSHWWKLIPHGIFELPAIFIALGLGVYLGLSWRQQEKLATFKTRLIECLRTFVLIIAPMLGIAAIIESILI